jgi:hypothetical protein
VQDFLLLGGKKLLVKDKDQRPDKRKIVLLSKDPALIAPAPQSGDDPTIGGASVALFNPTSGEIDTFELPASGWDGLGNPDGIGGFKYKDRELANGPCKVAVWKPGRVLKVVCKGDQIAYSLNESQQGSVGAAVLAGSTRLCSVFGGDVKRDRPAADGRTGLFRAKNALAPASCGGP